MMRLILVISVMAIALSYFGANVVFAACTVKVSTTEKTQDVVSTECVWNEPSNAYIIIKEVTWVIKWNEIQFGWEELYVTGSGQCSFSFLPSTKCFPQFPAAHTEDSGKKWVQQRADQTYSGGSCHQGPFISFERDSSAIAACNNTQDECEQGQMYWNPFSDSCQEDAPPECNLLPELCENGQWSFQWCGCVGYPTPIVVDVAGNGFDLTSAQSGVTFNLNTIGGKEKLAWTSGSSDDAWLVLDRNGNGTIDDGTELFGDVSAQPDPPTGEKKNGFRALAEYDKTSNGGNGNGQIDNGDSVFASLRLWQDSNHDGQSELSELHTLASKNVAALELDYKYSRKMDSHGNQFGFRAKIKSSDGQKVGRWAWDVYLVRSL